MSRLPLRVRVGYALGSITTGTYGTVPGLIVMPFLTDHLGVTAAAAGAIAFAPKAWDFVLNPVAGRVSDRARKTLDRRRPFLLPAGVLLAVTFVALFSGPSHPAFAAGAWVLVASLACATAYAFFQVPFLAMAAEITDDYTERTRLMTWRVAVLSLAILAAGGTAPLLVQLGDSAPLGDGDLGYRLMATVMAVLMLAGAAGVWLGTRNVPRTRHEEAGGRGLAQLRVVWENLDARALFFAFCLQAIAVGMLLAGVLYVARHVVRAPGTATLAFVCFVVPALVCAPAWQRVGARLGKKRGFVVATLVMGVGLVALLVSITGELVPMLAAAALVGAGYAGAQIFPLAMLPDIAAHDAQRSGRNRIGMIAGLWSGVELLGLALGPALLGAVLDLGGYVEATGGAAEQAPAVRLVITVAVSVIPAALCFASLVPLSRYRLDAILRAGHTPG